MNEALRMAQRSPIPRYTLKQCKFKDVLHGEPVEYTIPPDYFVITNLGITNWDTKYLPSHPPLNQVVSDRFVGNDPNPAYYSDLGLARYCFSPFGHGVHACPGRKFGTSVIKIVIAKLVSKFELTPKFDRLLIPSVGRHAIPHAPEPTTISYVPRAAAATNSSK